jgi:hypothetical protein
MNPAKTSSVSFPKTAAPLLTRVAGMMQILCFGCLLLQEAQAQLDDFNDGNDTAPPPGWQRLNPIGTGAFAFPGGNAYRLQTVPSPDPGNFGPGRLASIHPGDYTNFFVAVDIVAWDDSLHQVAGVLARVSTPGAGTTSGYMFSHDRGNPASATDGDVDIVRLDGEVATSLKTTGSERIHFEPGQQYRLIFQGIGTNFVGQVFALPNTAVPVVEVSATDGAYGSGPSGIVIADNSTDSGFNGAGDVTFDNYLAGPAYPSRFDNFNDGNDTNPLPGWWRYDPLTIAQHGFPEGSRYRISSPPSPDPGTFGQARAGSIMPMLLTNFYVAADLVAWDDSIHQISGLMARVGTPGPGTTTGYLFTHDRGNPSSTTSGDMDIVRLENEVPVSLPTEGADAIHFEPGRQYRLEFIGEGNSFTGRVYELPNLSIPLVEITAVDDVYSSGAPGLVVANNAAAADGPADATFDNFLAVNAEPRLSYSLADGQIGITWPLSPFVLQSTSQLHPANWQNVISGVTQNSGTNTYAVPASGGGSFFRLAYPY